MSIYQTKRDPSLNNEKLIEDARSGDEYAKELLFRNNIPLIRKYVRRWINNGVEESYDELMSLGFLALTKSFKLFNPSKGCKFVTYLVRALENEIRCHLRTKSRKINHKYHLVSIDEQINKEEQQTLHEYIGTNENEIDKFEQYAAESIVRDAVSKFYRIASDQEKRLLQDVYLDNEPISEMHKKWNTSRQRIHQINIRCIEKLQLVMGIQVHPKKQSQKKFLKSQRYDMSILVNS